MTSKGKIILMKKLLIIFSLLILPISSIAGTFANGVPVAVRKSDWSKNLIFIRMAEPVSNPANCGSDAGLVVYDDNPSARAALSFALTALTTGMKFQCYVEDECSKITGNATTYPVCSMFPEIVK